MNRRLRVVRWFARILRVDVEVLPVDDAQALRDDAHTLRDEVGALRDDLRTLRERASPLEAIHRLEDDPAAAYVWQLQADATDRDREELAAALTSRFVQHYGREPRALHVITSDLRDLRHLTEQDVRRHIRPWLQERGAPHADRSDA